MRIYVDFPLEVAAWMDIVEGMNIALESTL